MIVGSGIDLVEIGRIQQSMDRYGSRFLDRVYTAAEQAYCLGKRNSAESFAARFAAKEAGAKALGTGISYRRELAGDRGRPRAKRQAHPALPRPRRPDCRRPGRQPAPRSPSPTPPALPWPAWCSRTGNRASPFCYPQGVYRLISCEGIVVPSRKEIQWSQLRVGALVLAATARADRAHLPHVRLHGRSFRPQARFSAPTLKMPPGLKDGAPVTLEGVTIGNVIHVRVVADRNPTPVEVTMQVGHEWLSALHADSTAAIEQAGVLGDSYVDLSSSHASGPPPANDAELKASGSPSIQDVIRTSDESIRQLTTLTKKIEITMDSINSKKGSAGEFINDPALYNKLTRIADDLQTITGTVAAGNGSLGKFIADDTQSKPNILIFLNDYQSAPRFRIRCEVSVFCGVDRFKCYPVITFTAPVCSKSATVLPACWVCPSLFSSRATES